MSSLTEALNRIMNWLKRFSPEQAALLSPGLTEVEIESLVQDLPIKLPPEVCELYRWSNGCLDDPYTEDGFVENYPYIFNRFALLPLQLAVERYKNNSGRFRFFCEVDEIFDNCKYLNAFELFFSYIDDVRGYLIIHEKKEVNPVLSLYTKDYALSSPHYDSLTSMMLTVADYYEIAYFINDEGYMSRDPMKVRDGEKITQIWHKYNVNQVISPFC